MVCPGKPNLWKVAVIGTTTYVKGSDIECTKYVETTGDVVNATE
jgi:hypothetical protein